MKRSLPQSNRSIEPVVNQRRPIVALILRDEQADWPGDGKQIGHEADGDRGLVSLDNKGPRLANLPSAAAKGSTQRHFIGNDQTHHAAILDQARKPASIDEGFPISSARSSRNFRSVPAGSPVINESYATRSELRKITPPRHSAFNTVLALLLVLSIPFLITKPLHYRGICKHLITTIHSA